MMALLCSLTATWADLAIVRDGTGREAVFKDSAVREAGVREATWADLAAVREANVRRRRRRCNMARRGRGWGRL